MVSWCSSSAQRAIRHTPASTCRSAARRSCWACWASGRACRCRSSRGGRSSSGPIADLMALLLLRRRGERRSIDLSPDSALARLTRRQRRGTARARRRWCEQRRDRPAARAERAHREGRTCRWPSVSSGSIDGQTRSGSCLPITRSGWRANAICYRRAPRRRDCGIDMDSDESLARTAPRGRYRPRSGIARRAAGGDRRRTRRP